MVKRKSKKFTKLLLILPAFNEEKVIVVVIKDLKKALKKFKTLKSQILVVDDGSTDKTGFLAQKQNVKVARHVINRGLGGALKTGLEYAKNKGFDIAVTMDSDGQHQVADLKRLIQPILNQKVQVVIGSRFLKRKSIIPWDRQIILWLSNLVTFAFFGFYTTDSQSGFRAFSKEAIQKINLRTQRMEVSSELFEQIKTNGFKLKEVPIKVVYTQYSRSKGQTNLNGFKILVKLILRLAR